MSSDFGVESLLQQKPTGESQAISGTKRKADSGAEQTQTAQMELATKRRRVRTTYSNEQLRRLHGYFAMSPYPDLLMRQQIAEIVGVPEQKIQVWFQNRRAKMRKYENSRTVQLPSTLAIPAVSNGTSPAHFASGPRTSSTPLTTSAHSLAATDNLPLYFPLRDPGLRHNVPSASTPSPPLPENIPPPHQFPLYSHPESYTYMSMAHSQPFPPPGMRVFREVSPSTHAVPRTPSPGCMLTPPQTGKPFYTDLLPHKYSVPNQQLPVTYRRV